MSEEVKNFIDKMAQNDMVGAGDAFKDALRAKVGDQLDVKRQDVAGNMFQAQSHSDPKPEIAGTGTFTQDGQVEPTGANAQAETQPETPEVSNAESQPADTDATGV
jgi:PDZ domain-containing secreted protein